MTTGSHSEGGLPATIRVAKHFLTLTVPEPLASREFLYLQESNGELELYDEPKESFAKCRVYRGGQVLFFRPISEEAFDELVEDYCEFIPRKIALPAKVSIAGESTEHTFVSVDSADPKDTARRFLRVLMANDPVDEAIRQSDSRNPQAQKQILEYAEKVLAGRRRQFDEALTAH